MDEKEKNKNVENYVQDVNKTIAGGGDMEPYIADLTKSVEGNHGDVIKKLIEGQEEYKNSKRASDNLSRKSNVFAFGAIIFTCLAITMFIVFWEHTRFKDVTTVAPQYPSLIFADHTEPDEIDGLSKDEIEKSVLDLVNNTTVKEGGVEGIYPTVKGNLIGLREFLKLIGSDLKLGKLSSVNDNFLLGSVHYVQSNVSSPVEDTTTSNTPPTPTVVEGKPVTLNSSAFFKTGTTDFINPDAKDKAEKDINDFLDGIDFTTTTINVVGTYSVERPSDKNTILAEARQKLGLDILNEVLNAKYSTDEISQITINSSTKGVSIKDTYTKDEINVMTKDELSAAVDATQGIQYFAQAKTKPEEVPPVGSDITTEADNNTDKSEISTNSNTGFFMLLKTNSFSDVFPTMHSWESNMFSDLHGFFGIDITSDNTYLLTKNFEDVIIQNKNARILYDNNDNIVLMYVFADNSSVLITRSENVAREVILRLTSSQIKK